MAILTQILKDEHQTILKQFKQLELEETFSESRKIEFEILKFILKEHLKKEDIYLYPKIKTLQKDDKIAEEFSKEMQAISQTILEFFKKYQKDGDGMEFSKELGIIIGTLKKRIIHEEEVLLPKYEETINTI